MSAWIWLLIIVVVGVVAWVAVSIARQRKFSRDLEAQGMVLEDAEGDGDEDDDEEKNPAVPQEPERSAMRERAAKLGAGAREGASKVGAGVSAGVFSRFFPLFLLAVIVGMGWWLSSRVSSVSKRTADVEIALAGKADTTVVQDLAATVADHETQIASLDRSMSSLADLVSQVDAKAVNASTAAENAKSDAQKAVSAAASVKKYATKVEARVARLEKQVKADSAATSKVVNVLDSRISANAGVANERINGVYGHVNTYEVFNDSVVSRAEERLQNLEEKLQRCKMKRK